MLWLSSFLPIPISSQVQDVSLSLSGFKQIVVQMVEGFEDLMGDVLGWYKTYLHAKDTESNTAPSVSG